MSKLICVSLCFILLANSSCVFAFETDQYDLPPATLADIGGEVSVYAAENIEKAFAKINAKILEGENCLLKIATALSQSPEFVLKMRIENYLKKIFAADAHGFFWIKTR